MESLLGDSLYTTNNIKRPHKTAVLLTAVFRLAISSCIGLFWRTCFYKQKLPSISITAVHQEGCFAAPFALCHYACAAIARYGAMATILDKKGHLI